MAAEKKTQTGASSTRSFELMTDDELVRELAHLYSVTLDRLHTHLMVGTGDEGDGTAAPIPAALEIGLALHGKLEALTRDYMHGVGVYADRDSLTGWTWGLRQCEGDLRQAAAAQVVFPDGGQA